MRILFTGASSVTGRRVLERLLQSSEDAEFWCVRHHSKVDIIDARVRIVDLNLAESFAEDLLPDAIDVTIHFAGVSHAHAPDGYWNINHLGTMSLAKAVRARGCRRFAYISTRCATAGSGAYGESKLAAENDLQKLSWDSLLIVRPSEIYGAQGKEGVDKLFRLAALWHLTPWLFGNSQITFAPLHIDDFVRIVADEIMKPAKTSRTIEICGPEDLNARELATRISQRYKALPVPLWWPLFALFLKIAAGFNLRWGVPDQITRLTGAKTATARSADRTGCTRFLLD